MRVWGQGCEGVGCSCEGVGVRVCGCEGVATIRTKSLDTG